MQVEWSKIIFPYKDKIVRSEVPSAAPGVLLFLGRHRNDSWELLGVVSAEDLQVECLDALETRRFGFQTNNGLRLRTRAYELLQAGVVYCIIRSAVERQAVERYLAETLEVWSLRPRRTGLYIPVNLP